MLSGAFADAPERWGLAQLRLRERYVLAVCAERRERQPLALAVHQVVPLEWTRPLEPAIARAAGVVAARVAPGMLSGLGLAWNDLHRANPALILGSVAPFGQAGPYRDFEADDTVLSARGGMLYVNGFPGHAPVRPLGLQAYHSASYYGAIAAMCALFARDRDGIGQWVDLSMQEATASAVEHVAPNYFSEGVAEPRRGTLHWTRYFRTGKCRDGYIMHCTLGDWTSLIEWVKSDGKAADLDAPEYDQVLHRFLMAEHLFDVLDEWVKDKPRDEVVAPVPARRLQLRHHADPAAADGEHGHLACQRPLEERELGAVARGTRAARLRVRLRAVAVGVEIGPTGEDQAVERVERLLHPALARRHEQRPGARRLEHLDVHERDQRRRQAPDSPGRLLDVRRDPDDRPGH